MGYLFRVVGQKAKGVLLTMKPDKSLNSWSKGYRFLNCPWAIPIHSAQHPFCACMQIKWMQAIATPTSLRSNKASGSYPPFLIMSVGRSCLFLQRIVFQRAPIGNFHCCGRRGARLHSPPSPHPRSSNSKLGDVNC